MILSATGNRYWTAATLRVGFYFLRFNIYKFQSIICKTELILKEKLKYYIIVWLVFDMFACFFQKQTDS